MLELKIPPVVLGAIVALLMWGATHLVPSIAIPTALRVGVALALMVLGAGLSFAGAALFRRARTTINPTRPDETSSLITSGVYRFTRNPMYLGFSVVMLAWAVFLANPLALVGVAIFMLYLTRFQIIPEERALTARFGAEFAKYKSKVRRWI